MSTATNRLGYLDNIRTAMTILVLAVHSAITYGSEGGWYFQEATSDMLTIVPLTLLSAVSQSFFMSLLFFVAAYFTPASYDRKGALRFVRDRLIRLGVPSLLFALAIGPLTVYLTLRFLEGGEFVYRQAIHIGPLWFAQALLIFTGAYVLYRIISRRAPRDARSSAPSARNIAVLGVVMAVLTFFARWLYPMGSGIAGMQLGSFPQYIMMFVLGIIAFRRDWLKTLPKVRVAPLAIAAGALTLLLPVAMFLGADPETGFENFMGGASWQAGFYAAWESAMCVIMSLLVLAFFRRKASAHTTVTSFASHSAFGVYVFHPAVLVGMTIVLAGVHIHPIAKFVMLLAAGTLASFAVSSGVRRTPILRRVF